MELSQIKYFVVLAQTLHFTRAAETCNVSQPALTRAIQKLEQELGGPLFLRERSHTQLTELGQLVRPSLERTLAAARDARSQADAFRRRETSPLRIGLEYSVPTAVLTPVLSALRRQNTEIELTLRQGSQAQLSEQMLAGEIDLSLLVNGPDLPERMHRWDMFSERYVLLCPPEHRFREHERVTVPDLAEECLLLHEDAACPLRRYVSDLFEQNGVRPRRQHFGSSLEQILEMVHASLGVSLAGERLPATAPVLRRPIDAEQATRSVVLAVVAGRQLGPTAALCVKLLRARAWTQDSKAEAA
ncbi:MAG: LysR family transcriptional regulator [Acetobacteraceae bacterium]|nr:LysR family transcriptional regulator [Pseudomonadota bacterium]